MAEQPRQQRRSLRVSLPSRPTIPAIPTSRPTPRLPHHPTTSTPTATLYPHFPYPHPTTPAPTPSKHRISALSATRHTTTKTTTSLSTLFLLLFSLRSLYSLLPFIRSSPSSFSIFPFSFLVSLLSFLLTLSFSLFSKSIFSPTSITRSQHKHLFSKSLLLAAVFLLRFQALRYCGTAAMILAEFAGTISARFLFDGQNRNFIKHRHMIKVRGFLALSVGLLFLSLSWDRVECFPLSFINLDKLGWFSFLPDGNCVRIWPLLLPFLSGFLGCYERVSMNSVDVKELGPKRFRLISLFYTTIVLFVPAVISMFVFEAEGDSVLVRSLGWPLANTVVFGVLLSENYTDDYKVASLKDFRREFLVTFVCTLVLELFYSPELSLWGLLLCGLLFGIAVRELNPFYSNYVELGSEPSESLTSLVMKPIRHILNERKSRKIALFLLINTGYMVVEFVVGFMSNSLGLISDACHMLFDCAALAIGLYASYISRLPANGQYNYGRGRFEVLSGYVNAVFLVLVGALIVLESLERILEPQEISTSSLLTVSIGGLVVNAVGLIFFHDEHHHAHGGSCSHSDAHGHTHFHAKSLSNHSHDHVGHNHGVHGKHQKNHEHHNDQCTGGRCSDHDHRIHEHNHHHHEDHHDHEHQHNHHHDHEHQHDHRFHEHNHHHHEDHHDHEHQHNHHHDHEHQHDHHRDHEHQHDHHGEHHDHHDHNHDHGSHEHDHKHDHEPQHNRHDGHSHGTTSVTATGKGPEKHQHHHIDHNMEGIFLHILADTLGSVGVVISTLLIRYKGWLVADPAASIFISVLIVSSVIPLLRNSAEILLQRVPKAHEKVLKETVRSIMKIKGVSGIQKLHVWSFTSTDVVGTIRLRVSSETDKGSTKAQVSDILHDAGVKDLTVEVECVQSN